MRFVETVVAEYERIWNLKGGAFGTRKAEMKKFNLMVFTMKRNGTISDSEYSEIQAEIKGVERMNMDCFKYEIGQMLKGA